ncbi:hypothetical protein ACWCQZ_47850 [Streptomyces sp. NPDC002285]
MTVIPKTVRRPCSHRQQGGRRQCPRLLDLDSRSELTAAHVRLVAQALGKSERTVWRWLAATRKDHRLARLESSHFTVTTETRRLLALWDGNASPVHAELVQRAADDPDAPAAPSLSTLHRAIRRDLTRGGTGRTEKRGSGAACA